MNSARKAAVATAMMGPLLFPTQALAQQTAGKPAADVENADIVVTAQQRSENAQDVPIAVTAISGTALTDSGVRSTDQLSLVTPGLQYVRALGSSTPYIRGVGIQDTSSGNEASVATYIDGVYVRDLLNASQNFNAVERVEVLKGPQGTLFGRNATGGVIQTITKMPSRDTEAIFGASLANYATYGGDFYGTTGLGSVGAINLAVSVQRQDDGYGKNLVNGANVGYDDYTQIRSKILLQPTENTDIVLTGSWGEKQNDFGVIRNCAPGALCFAGARAPARYNDTSVNDQPIVKSRGWLASGRLEQHFGSVDLVSITAYQDNSSTVVVDQDNSSLPLVLVALNQTSKTFSQEVQLLSTTDSPFQWIVGGFFWDDEAAYDPATVSGAANPANVILRSKLKTRSYAAFGQASYSFSEATKLTVGARYTRDEKTISGVSTLFGGGVVSGPQIAQIPFGPQSKTYSEPTFRAALSHDLSPDVMVYVSYNRGFKSGTYNTFLASGVIQPALDPEIVNAYSLGFKGDLFDRRLRLNVEAFRYNYKNIQLQRIDGPSTVLVNAASAVVNGVELEASVRATDRLGFKFTAEYLDATYSQFPAPSCVSYTDSATANGGFGGSLLGTRSCTGNRMILAPEYTLGLVADYNVDTSIGNVKASVTTYYNDGYFIEPENRYRQNSYALVNASFKWTSLNDRYSIALFAKNIFDKEYSPYRKSSSFGDFYAAATNPRLFGVRLEAKFK